MHEAGRRHLAAMAATPYATRHCRVAKDLRQSSGKASESDKSECSCPRPALFSVRPELIDHSHHAGRNSGAAPRLEVLSAQKAAKGSAAQHQPSSESRQVETTAIRKIVKKKFQCTPKQEERQNFKCSLPSWNLLTMVFLRFLRCCSQNATQISKDEPPSAKSSLAHWNPQELRSGGARSSRSASLRGGEKGFQILQEMRNSAD